MDVQHLHDIRDGKFIRRRRSFIPYIHVSTKTPLMLMLFNITRPVAPKNKNLKPLLNGTRIKIVKGVPAAGVSMVSYARERKIPNR